MIDLVSERPYVPVPPYHGRLWPALLMRIVPWYLRKQYGVHRVQCVNAERLAESIRAGHGIVLAPNHCRDEDPIVLGVLARCVQSPFFIMASWHLFMRGGLKAWLVRRAGAFSVYREGIDRAAVNSAIQILEHASRPLVIFPEGFIARTNDRINELLEGTALIARTAAKKRAKMDPPRKVVVHPVAIRYRFHGDIDAAATRVLDEIETRLSWRPNRHLTLLERIYKVGEALLTLKELQYLGRPQTGDIATRLPSLINAILWPLEDEWTAGDHSGSTNARVKRLRAAILPDMIKAELDEPERQRRWRQLEDVYLANLVAHFPPDYVKSNPTPERILETLEKFEEGLTDRLRVHGELSATVTVGQAIQVQPARERPANGADPLLIQIESQLRQMLGIEPAPSANQSQALDS
ncbi:1-acyl-sn-glycerol-3-phosphate acyltransferase [Fontivita pretiosa]|uniref:1-acyl-sn-glycerol-3-phosphate acyltransferase n=1 Tax=Fontivita pretiosa TaxID=2989684 RepID=UPI003D16C501